MTDVVFTLPATEADEVVADEVRHEVKPGDVFYSSWGYDQTNIDFYVVESVTKSGKSVRVHRVASKRVGFELPSDLVVPDVSQRSTYNGESMTRRLSWWKGQPSFRVASYAHAYLWNGEPKRETNSAFGH